MDVHNNPHTRAMVIPYFSSLYGGRESTYIMN